MVTFQEAGAMLDEACEALPQGIFRELNGGVNLSPEARRGEDGSCVLGLYHHDAMGRYIEIFYGSIAALYGDIPPEKFRERLTKTLHHELTHHIENLAGDRTLEHWDEAQKALADLPPLRGDRVLFLDGDDGALAPAAAAFFNALCRETGTEKRAESAGMDAAGTLNADALRAAKNLGADFSGHAPRALTASAAASADVLVCMTALQADELAERFPETEERLCCLAETDLLPPKTRLGWGAAMRRLKKETEYLLEDLRGEDED